MLFDPSELPQDPISKLVHEMSRHQLMFLGRLVFHLQQAWGDGGVPDLKAVLRIEGTVFSRLMVHGHALDSKDIFPTGTLAKDELLQDLFSIEPEWKLHWLMEQDEFIQLLLFRRIAVESLWLLLHVTPQPPEWWVQVDSVIASLQLWLNVHLPHEFHHFTPGTYPREELREFFDTPLDKKLARMGGVGPELACVRANLLKRMSIQPPHPLLQLIKALLFLKPKQRT